jgi:ABC-type lipoprotein export system ATPase subunit
VKTSSGLQWMRILKSHEKGFKRGEIVCIMAGSGVGKSIFNEVTK